MFRTWENSCARSGRRGRLLIYPLRKHTPKTPTSSIFTNLCTPEQTLHHRVARYEDDLPRLTRDEIANYPNALEWWYFDYNDAQGVSIVVTLARRNSICNSVRSADDFRLSIVMRKPVTNLFTCNLAKEQDVRVTELGEGPSRPG